MDALVNCSIPVPLNTSKIEILITSALESIGGLQLSAEFLFRGCRWLKRAAFPKVLSSLHGCREREPVSNWLRQGFMNPDSLPQFGKTLKGHSIPSALRDELRLLLCLYYRPASFS